MVLAAATLKAVLELSPLNNTSVPPDKTGLAPIEASPALVPLETVDTLVLPEDEPELLLAIAEISKFQIPVEDPVCVKTNV